MSRTQDQEERLVLAFESMARSMEDIADGLAPHRGGQQTTLAEEVYKMGETIYGGLVHVGDMISEASINMMPEEKP